MNDHGAKLVLVIAALAAAGGPIVAAAAEPMALRVIMQDLGKRLHAVTDGLMREDFEAVEQAALVIADHPQPPVEERARIIAFFADRMSEFKAYDIKTHEAALELAAAAKRKDGPAIIDAFRSVQMGCHGCHSEFRKPFIEHFYGEP